MSVLSIHNPATGQLITTLPTDDAASVAAKYEAARGAQPAWALQPLAQRLRCIEQFRAGVVRDLEHLARVMTQETGKPIRMSCPLLSSGSGSAGASRSLQKKPGLRG